MNPDKATIQLINIINKNAFLGFDINSGRVYIENVQFVIDFKNNVLNLFTILIQTLKNHSE